jgi:hypothetical protein
VACFVGCASEYFFLGSRVSGRGCGQEETKGADLEVRAFVSIAASEFLGAGLSDDLGSLRQKCDGDRSKQGEGGGDAGDLGHFSFPLVFSVC